MSTVLFDAPGPRGRRRIAVINVVGALVVLGGLIWVIWALASKGQLAPEKWQPFLTASVWQDYLLVGLWNTLRAAGLSIVTSAIFGLIFGLGRLSQLRAVRAVCGVVVEFFRAVPVLIMMIFFYFLFSRSGAMDPAQAPFYGVVVGLTLYNGSVMAELVRSGVNNLPRGQREAGLAIGLTPGQSLRLVELPQALIAMLPSVISQLVVILKDTALGYIISYSELLRSARLVGSTFANYVPALIVAAVMFIVINYSLTWVAERVARRLSVRTTGTAALPDAGVAAVGVPTGAGAE
jgi:glutamate transport system permease protein